MHKLVLPKSLFLLGTMLSALPAAAATGDLLVSEYWNNRADRYTLDGTNQGVFATSTGTSRFYDMAFDKAGNLYVTGLFAHNVRKFSPTGIDLGDFADVGGNNADLVFDAAGNLYVSLNSTIRKISPTGADLGVFASNLSDPVGMVVDGSGNLEVACFGDGTVRRFSAIGTSLGVFAAGLSQPSGMAIDNVGNVYVSDRGTNLIHRYLSTGSDLGVFATGGMNNPIDMAFAPDGSLFVSNFQTPPFGGSSDGTISHFSATGANLGYFATGIASPSGLAFVPQAVPEPTTLVALSLGAVAVLRRRRR